MTALAIAVLGRPASSAATMTPEISSTHMPVVAAAAEVFQGHLATNGCLDPRVQRDLVATIQSINDDLAKGDAIDAVRDFGLWFRLAVPETNGAANILVDSHRLFQEIVTGNADVMPVTVTDPHAALTALNSTLMTSALAPAVQAALTSLVSDADTAFLAGKRRTELTQLAILLRRTTSFYLQGSSQLTSAQASAITSSAVGVIIYFDPVPLMAAFRKAIRANDMATVNRLIATRARSRLLEEFKVDFATPAQRANVSAIYTTNLSLASDHGDSREYDMTRPDPGGPGHYTIDFDADCDGVWRFSQL